ncbi:MAG: hypothetical protein ACK4QP_18980 [Pseudorhizobium sp.]
MMTFKAAKQACLTVLLSAVSAASQPVHQPPDGLPVIARDVLDLSRAQTQRARDSVWAGIEACFPAEVRLSLSDLATRTLLVDLHLLYFRLASEKLAEPDRHRQFALAIDKGRSMLPADQARNFEGLRLQGLEQGLTLLCVAATARGMLKSTSASPPLSRE